MQYRKYNKCEKANYTRIIDVLHGKLYEMKNVELQLRRDKCSRGVESCRDCTENNNFNVACQTQPDAISSTTMVDKLKVMIFGMSIAHGILYTYTYIVYIYK